MRVTALAIALLMSGAAVAQTTEPNPDVVNDDPVVTTTTTSSTMPASGAVVQPSNANPEHDARGIAVISDPAVVPAGWNGIAGTAMGGPLVDPATGETVSGSEDSYPPCTASRTDNCLQTYERGRAR